MKEHLKRNWKRYAVAAAVAGGVSYGVPPEATQAALAEIAKLLGL